MNSESLPFSVGVWPNGKPEKADIDADYLKEKEFTTEDDDSFHKELEPGKILVYVLSRYEIAVKKEDADPVVIAEGSPSTHYLEGLYKSITGNNL